MGNKIIFFIFSSLLINCDVSIASRVLFPIQFNKGYNSSKEASIESDSIVRIELSEGVFFSYNFQDSENYKLIWGNGSIENIGAQTFENLGSEELSLIDYNSKAIILGQGCGIYCFYYVVLSLQKGSEEKVYDSSIGYTLSYNSVAYIPIESDSLFVRIENYSTGQFFDIIETDLCPAASSRNCIFKSYFENDQFILQWHGSKWKSEKVNDLREKQYNYKFE